MLLSLKPNPKSTFQCYSIYYTHHAVIPEQNISCTFNRKSSFCYSDSDPTPHPYSTAINNKS